MSLLMDALRRAEAEKKAAAKNKPNDENAPSLSSHEVAEEDEDLGATVKLDRLPLPMASGAKANQDGTAPPSVKDITSSIEESLNDLSIDFESTSPRIPSGEILAADVSSKENEITADSSSGRGEAAQDETYDFSIHAESQIDEEGQGQGLSLEPIPDAEIRNNEPIPEPIPGSTSTLPSANKVNVPLENDPLEAQALAGNAEPTLAASEVDPLLIGAPGESTLETTSGQTAVSANTVFEAGSPGISRRIILWTLTLGIALLALLTVTGLYYFQQAPTTRPLPSPIASVELERARLKETQAASPNSPPKISSAQNDDAEQDATPEYEQTVGTVEPVLVEKNLDRGSKRVAQSAVNTDEDISPAVTQETVVEPATDPSPKIKQSDASTYQVAPTIDTKRLSVARSMRGVRSNEQVLAAYEAYQVGDLGGAKALYEKALAIRPQDINALNGLAALALGESNPEKAHQLYSQVLKLEPNNPTATTALFQIEGGVGNRVTETQLKMMLDNDGDPGLINFALGNLYSRHSRWNDAQLAFFEAVRHRPNNPDYLFNLAVSLDQIGQRAAAKGYYQKAVTAADESSAGFNAADAIARIQSISQSASASAP